RGLMQRNEPKNLSLKPHKIAIGPIKQTKKDPYFIVPKQEAPGCPIQRFADRPSTIGGRRSKLYHRTNRVAARRIMRHGFKDSTNYYMRHPMHTGAWLSSVPLDFQQGASGDVLLLVDTDLTENELARYEWVTEKEKGYREWQLPAALINPRMKVTIVR